MAETPMGNKAKNDEYSAQDAQRRFEAAIKSALNTPHKPLKEKPKVKKAVKKKKKSG
jgi:hypothetical protein